MDSLEIGRALPALSVWERCSQFKADSVPRAHVVSRVQLFVTPWTVDCQALLYMGFSSKSIGFPVLPPGDLSDPRIKPMSYMSPALAGRFFTAESRGRPLCALKSGQRCTVL